MDWQKLVLIVEWSYFWVVLIEEFYCTREVTLIGKYLTILNVSYLKGKSMPSYPGKQFSFFLFFTVDSIKV